MRISEALTLMGLELVGARMVRDYSGGMIRRLEIAQSMLHRPQVLFLDEPTIGLDPIARATVWDHVRRLRAQFGTTILMTTHLMEEAEAFCEHVAIMLDLRSGVREHAGHPQRRPAVSRFHGARHPRAKCAFRRDLLRHCRDLGTRSGNHRQAFVSPTPRGALVLGKALSAGIRSLSQILIIYSLAALLARRLELAHHGAGRRRPGRLARCGRLCHAVADHRRNRQDARALHGRRTNLDDALFFASNAIYPIASMPRWLQVVARANP